jgi:hypothetical protein
LTTVPSGFTNSETYFGTVRQIADFPDAALQAHCAAPHPGCQQRPTLGLMESFSERQQFFETYP